MDRSYNYSRIQGALMKLSSEQYHTGKWMFLHGNGKCFFCFTELHGFVHIGRGVLNNHSILFWPSIEGTVTNFWRPLVTSTVQSDLTGTHQLLFGKTQFKPKISCLFKTKYKSLAWRLDMDIKYLKWLRTQAKHMWKCIIDIMECVKAQYIGLFTPTPICEHCLKWNHH